MTCTTVRPGFNCFFMTKKGCTAPGGKCEPIVEQCNGCANVYTLNGSTYCKSFPLPSTKWSVGSCNLATHLEKSTDSEVRRVNPLKASKRGMTGKW